MSSMAAAEGSTWEGSAPQIQATSMHNEGRTRLPPESIEYLMASSSPSSRASSVNLRPARYSSKARLCVSHLIWLCVPLASPAMPHLTLRPQFRTAQDSPYECRRLLPGETFGELDRLVYSDVGGDVIDVEHLVKGEAQDRTVYRAHAVHGPTNRDCRENRIQMFLLLLHSTGEPDCIRLEVAPVLPPALHRRAQRGLVYVALVKVQERLLAGRAAAQATLPSTSLIP